ncbi:MAG TPA: putative maltokinase, partial [Vicinamibacterales bacterium]
SLPGTPVIYYGDEIGMGDNIYLGDRNGVRTPMQWTSDRNAGFSRADPARLYAAPIMDPVYGYQSVNVEAQERSAFSMLNWMKRLIGLRKQSKVFGRGSLEFLPTQNRKILAYLRRYEDELVLCVSNLARTLQPVELDLSAHRGLTPVEMLGLTEFPRIGELPYFLTLAPYHSYWFRLQQSPAPIAARLVPETAASPDTLPVFFMGAAWDTLLDGNVRTLIEREALGPFLARQRWFAGKARQMRLARFVDWGLLRRGGSPIFLTVVDVEYRDGTRERYFVPLTVAGHDPAERVMSQAPYAALARVTGARKGLIADGGVDEDFATALLQALEQQREVRTRRGVIRPRSTPVFETLRGDGPLTPHRLSVEQSNTSVTFGTRLIAKLFRRVESGPNPDVEIGDHLTIHTDFRRAPRVAGAFEYQVAGEPLSHLGVVHELVASQADGWTHALAELGRFFDAVDGRGEPPPDALPDTHVLDLASTPTPSAICDVAGAFIDTAQTLGRRTAELHAALASYSDDPAFVPEPFAGADVERLLRDGRTEARRALELVQQRTDLSGDLADLATGLLDRADQELKRTQEAQIPELTGARIRVHGDYHLGQVLWAEGDFYILDFEGEPSRSLEDRRTKESPLKDVAGMLRSFSYAAYAALFAHTATRKSEFERLERWAHAWQLWTGSAFLKGYLGALRDAAILPAAPTQQQLLLDVFLLDKAVYELKYELNNRPDWVRIPLRGMQELVAR